MNYHSEQSEKTNAHLELGHCLFLAVILLLPKSIHWKNNNQIFKMTQYNNAYRDVTGICLISPTQKVPKYETKDVTLQKIPKLFKHSPALLLILSLENCFSLFPAPVKISSDPALKSVSMVHSSVLSAIL